MADSTIADEDPRTAGELIGTEELLLQLLTANYRLALNDLKTWIVAAITDSAPGTLDTLNELAAALGDDPNFATTMTTALAGKQPLDTDLTAIAALVSAADKVPYSTGSGTWALAPFTAAARVLLDIPPYVAGRWYVPEGASIRGAGTAAATGLMRGRRWRLRYPITLDQLGVQITTLAASGNFQLGVYATDPTTGAPTGAALYAGGSVSTAATGAIADTGPNVALAAGDYWIFVNVDASAGSTVIFAAASGTGLGAAQAGGSTSLGNALGSAASITGHTKSQAYNSWPTLTGSFAADSLSETLGGSVPMIAFSPA